MIFPLKPPLSPGMFSYFPVFSIAKSWQRVSSGMSFFPRKPAAASVHPPVVGFMNFEGLQTYEAPGIRPQRLAAILCVRFRGVETVESTKIDGGAPVR